ncbi:MAG: glycosyltransferase [Clostridia bacterium]|nr:glycosyltransferase [Clostridia bacterium]MDD4387441.1 glycosyltransferase [Clostridia bacterium]
MKNKNTKFLFYIMFIFTLIYIFWRLLFTLPLNFGYLSLIIGLILIIIEIWDAIDFFIHFINILLAKKQKLKQIKIRNNVKFPDVDILIATYNEDLNLLEKTINGCLNLKYSNKSKLHIYICDDGNRSEVKELAKEMNVNYICRTNRSDTKAGNYNNALREIKSPYVVTFDADMIPMDDFLISNIKYFFNNEKIGFVQLPQSFYNSDIYQSRLNLSKLIPFEQQFFYNELQLTKNTINAAIYCGTNTIFLRKALDEVNGFATGTISEDIATGMLIEDKGYKCIAVDEIKASGYSVDDLSGFIKQRTRWARGCIQMLKKYKIFSLKGLNIRQKLEYFSCVSYWFFGIKRLTYLIIPILFGIFGIVVVDCNIITFLMFWLPMYILKRFVLDILYASKRSSTWNKIYETILAPILAFNVLIELIGIKKTTFEVSPKNNIPNKSVKHKIMLLSCHLILLFLNIFALVICIQKFFNTNLSIYYISLVWLTSNIFYLIVAIIFDIGKKGKLSEEFGVYAPCKCVLKNNSSELQANTKRISDDKLSIISDKELIINETNNIDIFYNEYQTNFTAIIKEEIENKNCKEYILEIINIDKKNKLSLYQIMYNRQPPKVDYFHKKALFDVFFRHN